MILGAALLAPFARLAADTEATLDVPAVSQEQEAWLVTYSPGEIYWQRFGHNAVWLREPALGLDHAFNFGYFDFAQERFLTRFIQGRMRYFSLARPALAEFEGYRRENRGITALKLELRPEQYHRLRDYLIDEVRPANREYLYDYYLNNCSTRVRDALDLALDGALSGRFRSRPATRNFRDHTRRLTSMDFWYYLGLEAALGSPVDRPNSRWEEMFIPAVVEESVVQLAAVGDRLPQPLVGARHVIFEPDARPLPGSPPRVWPRYLLAGLLLAAAFWLAARRVPARLSRGLVLAWCALAGVAGLILAGLWGLTDHEATRANANVLLFNPLVLAALFPRLRRAASVLLMAGTGVAVVLAAIPGGQYTLDVLALAAPMHLAAALMLWRWPRGPGQARLRAG